MAILLVKAHHMKWKWRWSLKSENCILYDPEPHYDFENRIGTLILRETKYGHCKSWPRPVFKRASHRWFDKRLARQALKSLLISCSWPDKLDLEPYMKSRLPVWGSRRNAFVTDSQPTNSSLNLVCAFRLPRKKVQLGKRRYLNVRSDLGL